MNYSMIFYIIGWILNVEAALMIPAGIVALLYGESVGWVFGACIALCLLLGLPLIRRQPANKVFYVREGSVTVALSWVIMSIMGALPFLLSGSSCGQIKIIGTTILGFCVPASLHSAFCSHIVPATRLIITDPSNL